MRWANGRKCSNSVRLRNSHKKMIKEIIQLLKNSNGIGGIFKA